MTYTIKIKHFEGPFDLLLFFIERDELDIYDIPIARITDDFLAYVRNMESLNIDLASEFILVAATLMRIKAKMLLPRKEIDEAGNEVDPRDELVQRLLEYKQYKNILEDLREFEDKRGKATRRGNVSTELHEIATRALVDVELESVTLFKLFKAFSSAMERFREESQRTIHTVMRYKYTVKEQQVQILDSIAGGRKKGFQELFGNCNDRIHAIVTFLALLELLNMQRVRVIQGIGPNNFWVLGGDAADEEE